MLFFRKVLFLLALGAAIWANPDAPMAQTTYEFADFDRIQIRAGLLELRSGESGMETLYLNGARIDMDRGAVHYRSIKGAWGRAEEGFDWVVISTDPGGNGNFGALRILRISPGLIHASEPIAISMIGELRALRVVPGRIEMDFMSPAFGISHRTYGFDGQTLTDRAYAADPTEGQSRAGTGPQVTRWVGAHPSEIFDDPGERARFLSIMDVSTLEELRSVIGPAGPVERRGNWVLGRGCRPHFCNSSTGGWAINVSNGSVVAFLLDRRRPDRLYGSATHDPIVRGFINEARP